LQDILALPELQGNAYKTIRKDIEKAQDKLDDDKIAKAYQKALKATDGFEKLTDPQADAIRLQLDNAIRAIARQL